jgi:hypothetical protein
MMISDARLILSLALTISVSSNGCILANKLFAFLSSPRLHYHPLSYRNYCRYRYRRSLSLSRQGIRPTMVNTLIVAEATLVAKRRAAGAFRRSNGSGGRFWLVASFRRNCYYQRGYQRELAATNTGIGMTTAIRAATTSIQNRSYSFFQGRRKKDFYTIAHQNGNGQGHGSIKMQECLRDPANCDKIV